MRPDYYHLHHSRYTEDNLFWMEVVKGCDSVLELGSGTGRISRLLSAVDTKVFGLDLDMGYLEFCQSQTRSGTESTSAELFLIQGDMRRIPLLPGVPAVISPCNTLSSFSSKDRQQIFNQISRLLLAKGVFVFSLPNPVLIQEIYTQLKNNPDPESQLEDRIIDPETGNPVQISSRMEAVSKGLRWLWYYDLLLPGGEVKRTEMDTIQSLDGIDVYRAQLKESDLKIIKEWGNFQSENYSKESPYWIVAAVK